MRTIVLIRHGKSSWEYDLSDRERPLRTRGKNDAKLVVNEFIQQSKAPKLIYSSPAKRALNTCEIFIKSLNVPEESVHIVEELYDFGGENVINFIKNLPNTSNEVMIFGHNHAFTSISNTFGNKYIENVPTSGLVKISFDITSWEDIKKGHTDLIIFPKDLRLKNG